MPDELPHLPNSDQNHPAGSANITGNILQDQDGLNELPINKPCLCHTIMQVGTREIGPINVNEDTLTDQDNPVNIPNETGAADAPSNVANIPDGAVSIQDIMMKTLAKQQTVDKIYLAPSEERVEAEMQITVSMPCWVKPKVGYLWT